jgi:hypothetical protein
VKTRVFGSTDNSGIPKAKFQRIIERHSAPRLARNPAILCIRCARTVWAKRSKPLKSNATLNLHLINHKRSKQLPIAGSAPIAHGFIIGKVKTPGARR